MAALKFSGFSFYCFCVVNFLALIHCSAASEVKTGLCVLRTTLTACSCSNERVVKVAVKYCGTKSGKCVPCQDLRTLCLRTCRKTAAETLPRLRQRRQVCPTDEGVSKGPPSVRITNGPSQTLTVDETLRIECEVKANPAAHVSWLFNGQPLKNSSRYKFSECKKVLQILNGFEMGDAGNYTCVGTNKLGNDTAVQIVSAITSPAIQQVSSFEPVPVFTAFTGGSVNITCEGLAKDGIIYFYKSGQMINEDKHFVYYHHNGETTYIFIKTSLEINNVSATDAGSYTCIVMKDEFNKVNKSAHVTVVPCPKGHFCPPWENEKHPCPPGTYNDGTNNVTYECTPCPNNFGNNFTESPSGLTSSSGCIPDRQVSPIRSGRSSPTDMVWYISIPASVLVVVVLAVGLHHCLVKRRSVSIGGGEIINISHPIHYEPANREQDSKWRIPESGETDFEKKYDVFVCYSSKDTQFVQELIEELERREFLCCVDFRDFVAGATIVENITDAIYSSRKTLAVLSPDFIQSKWCRHEIQTALAVIGSHVVVPILLKECEIPTLLRDRTYLDWESSVIKPYLWDALAKALRVD